MVPEVRGTGMLEDRGVEEVERARRERNSFGTIRRRESGPGPPLGCVRQK